MEISLLFRNTDPRSVAGWPVSHSDAVLCLAYAAGYWALHEAASLWGGAGYYSLWYPPAGLEFALMWRKGARWAFVLAPINLLVLLARGILDFASPDFLHDIVSAIRPVVAYGLTVAAVRHFTRHPRTSVATEPMPFGIAAVLAPFTAALFALPWSVLRPDLTGVAGKQDVILSLSGFAIGDLLGVLLIAPPLLTIWGIASGELKPRVHRIRFGHAAEVLGVLGTASLATVLLLEAGLGLQAVPATLAVVWIGLRFGRAAAWHSIIVFAAFALGVSPGLEGNVERLALHMGLSTIVVAGFLAGSFRDAQARAQTALARRDRLLFQAERLKTLHAMSVAVIHEISQPLSTLTIEARRLHQLSVNADPEIAQGAALIDRKATTLSDLVRRLRRFGGRSVEEPANLPVSAFIETVGQLAKVEAKAAGVKLRIGNVEPMLVVLGQEVELAQALVNLVRNAIQRCDGAVLLWAEDIGDQVRIIVSNRCPEPVAPGSGMGIGLLISRAIVEAHGGRIESERRGPQFLHRLILPAGEME